MIELIALTRCCTLSLGFGRSQWERSLLLRESASTVTVSALANV